MAAGPARMKLYQGAEQRLLDDGAWVTLYHYASRALIRPGCEGARALAAVHRPRVPRAPARSALEQAP